MAVAIYNDYLRSLLKNQDCILAFDTAADYLGLTNGGYRPFAQILVKKPVGLEGVQEKVVDDYSQLEYTNVNGLKCTTVNQTIIDLLENDGDEQIITECLANYYESHEENFKELKIPVQLEEKFKKYSQWAVEYYEE